MRNLKKVLSLALALVMLVGMMVVGAGAVETKFVDDGKIGDSYKEAVAVMSEIKVLGGKENNNFDPKGTLTRAEAAKILCVMTMGADAAEGLAGVTKSGVFTDMPDHWAAGYVDACYNKGIVLGMAEGIYGPSNTLTGTQFAAMLLRAMGVEGEFTGPSWESAVIAAAAKAKLSEMTTKPIAREAASKMAFDGLQYSPSGSKSYTVGNQSFDDFFEAYIYAQNNGGKIEITTAKDSLASTVFGLKKADQSANGRNGYTWQLDNKDITGFMPTDGVLYVSTDGTTLANIDVKADDSVKYFLNGTEKTTSTDVTNEIKRGNELTLVDVDGDDKYDKVLVVEKTLKTAASDPVEKNEKVSITGVLTKATDVKLVSGWEDVEKGDKVLTYTMADKITYIEKLDTVTGVVTKRTGSGSTEKTFTVDGSEYNVATVDSSAKDAAVDALNAALGEDDGVKLFLDADSNVWAVESAVVKPINYAVLLDIVWVKGAVTAGGKDSGYAEAQLLLMDGTTKKVRVDSINGATPVGAVDSKKDVDLVENAEFVKQDTLENLLKSTTTGAVQGNAAGTALAGGNYYGFATSATALDHTKGLWIALNNVNDNSDSLNDTLEGVFYLYEDTSTEGHVTLKTVGINQDTGAALTDNGDAKAQDGSSTAYSKGAPSIGGVPVNNNTKFVIKNGNKYEAYTGITGDDAMISINATTSKCVVKNGIATHVYVASATPTASAAEYIFITSSDYTYDASSKAYTFSAIVDGEETEVEAVKATGFDPTDIGTAGLYEVTRNNKDQLVSATPKNTKTLPVLAKTTTITKAEAGTITVSESLTYTDESKVFYIAPDGTVTTGAAADVQADNNTDSGTLSGAWAIVKGATGADAATLDTLYILNKAAAAEDGGDNGGGNQGEGEKKEYSSVLDGSTVTDANGKTLLKMSDTTKYTINKYTGVISAMNVLDGASPATQIKDFLTYSGFTGIGEVKGDASKYSVTAKTPDGTEITATVNYSAIKVIYPVTVNGTAKYVDSGLKVDGTGTVAKVQSLSLAAGHAKVVANGTTDVLPDAASDSSTPIVSGAVYTEKVYTKVTPVADVSNNKIDSSTDSYDMVTTFATGKGTIKKSSDYYLPDGATMTITFTPKATLTKTVTFTVSAGGLTGTATAAFTKDEGAAAVKTVTLTAPSTPASDVTVSVTKGAEST